LYDDPIVGAASHGQVSFREQLRCSGIFLGFPHATISEAIEEAVSLIVPPTVVGFQFAFYLSLSETFARE